VPHFLLTRLAAGDVKALPRVFGVLAAIPGALGRRRPLRRETMAIIDALTLKPALDLEGARRLRENPPKTSLLSLIGRRMRGIRG
jgi:hypothetical protein